MQFILQSFERDCLLWFVINDFIGLILFLQVFELVNVQDVFDG